MAALLRIHVRIFFKETPFKALADGVHGKWWRIRDLADEESNITETMIKGILEL